MFLITFFTTIINFLAGAATFNVIDQIIVKIDIGVYKLVSTSFTLFTIMCQLNLNVIYSIADSIVDRLKALIIVFVIFKVGVSLLKYLLDPENAAKASKKLLINLLICATLLVSYNTVFKVFNELSMMIIGKPASYHYTTLKQIADASDSADEGLIMRLFFGKKGNVSLNTSEDIGKDLAFNSLCATFPDKNHEGLQCTYLSKELKPKNGEINIDKLENILPHIKKNVDAHPFIAAILGLYIVYTVIKASVAIGVRMFKLMLLQLVAPIAIISVASEEGTKAKVFSSFIKVYIEVFVSAFIRIIAILLVTVFVSKVFIQINAIIGDVTNSAGSNYSLWIILICIFAGYKFAEEIPAMIEKIFDKKFGDSGGKGFGKFLGTLMALPTLGAIGMARGALGGETWQSGVYGALAGGLGGMTAALQGNTIADKFKAMNENQKKVNGVQSGLDSAGGHVFPYMWGRIQGKTWQDKHVGRMDRAIGEYDDISKDIDAYVKERNSAIKDEKVGAQTGFFDGIKDQKFTDNKDTFVSSNLDYHKGYNEAKARVAALKASGASSDDIARTQAKEIEERNNATKALTDMWKAKRNNTAESKTAAAYRQEIEKRAAKLGTEVSIDANNVGDSTDEAKRKLAAASEDTRIERREFTQKNYYKGQHPGNKS